MTADERRERPPLPDGFDELMGERSYCFPPPWEWEEDERMLTLRPRRRMPTSWWVCGLGLVPAFSAAVYFLCVDSAQISPAALAAICIAMPTIVMALFVLVHRVQLSLGPWAVLDRTTGELALPRSRVTLDAAQVDGLQLIGGTSGGGGANSSRVWEVNALVLSETPPRRYGVVGAMDRSAAKAVADRLQDALDEVSASDRAI